MAIQNVTQSVLLCSSDTRKNKPGLLPTRWSLGFENVDDCLKSVFLPSFVKSYYPTNLQGGEEEWHSVR